MKNIVVLIHKSNADDMPAIDVLVRNDAPPDIKTKVKRLVDEPAFCPYVEQFLREHPEYERAGSLDFQHIYAINAGVVKSLILLGKLNPEIKIIPE